MRILRDARSGSLSAWERVRVRASVPLLLAFVFFVTSLSASAHEVRPAYLELRQTTTDTYDVLWKVPARGDNMRLGIYVEFPSDTTKVTPPRTLFANDASTERWSIKRPGGLAGDKININGLAAIMRAGKRRSPGHSIPPVVSSASANLIRGSTC